MEELVFQGGDAMHNQSNVPLEPGTRVHVSIEENFQLGRNAQNSALVECENSNFDDAHAFVVYARMNYELVTRCFFTHHGFAEGATASQRSFLSTVNKCMQALAILSDIITSLESAHVSQLRAEVAFAGNQEETGNDLMWAVIWLYEKLDVLQTKYYERSNTIQSYRVDSLMSWTVDMDYYAEHEKLEQQTPRVLWVPDILHPCMAANKHVERVDHFSRGTQDRLFVAFCSSPGTSTALSVKEKEMVATASDVTGLQSRVAQLLFDSLTCGIKRDHIAAKKALFDRNYAICEQIGLRAIHANEVALFVASKLYPSDQILFAKHLHILKLYVCLNEKLKLASSHERLARIALETNELGNMLEHLDIAMLHYDKHDEYSEILNVMLHDVMRRNIEYNYGDEVMPIYAPVRNTLAERQRALELYETARARAKMLSQGAIELQMLLNRTHQGFSDASTGIRSALIIGRCK